MLPIGAVHAKVLVQALPPYRLATSCVAWSPSRRRSVSPFVHSVVTGSPHFTALATMTGARNYPPQTSLAWLTPDVLNDAAEGTNVKGKSHETPGRTGAKAGKLMLAGFELEGISIGGQVQ